LHVFADDRGSRKSRFFFLQPPKGRPQRPRRCRANLQGCARVRLAARARARHLEPNQAKDVKPKMSRPARALSYLRTAMVIIALLLPLISLVLLGSLWLWQNG